MRWLSALRAESAVTKSRGRLLPRRADRVGEAGDRPRCVRGVLGSQSLGTCDSDRAITASWLPRPQNTGGSVLRQGARRPGARHPGRSHRGRRWRRPARARPQQLAGHESALGEADGDESCCWIDRRVDPVPDGVAPQRPARRPVAGRDDVEPGVAADAEDQRRPQRRPGQPDQRTVPGLPGRPRTSRSHGGGARRTAHERVSGHPLRSSRS